MRWLLVLWASAALAAPPGIPVQVLDGEEEAAPIRAKKARKKRARKKRRSAKKRARKARRKPGKTVAEAPVPRPTPGKKMRRSHRPVPGATPEATAAPRPVKLTVEETVEAERGAGGAAVRRGRATKVKGKVKGGRAREVVAGRTVGGITGGEVERTAAPAGGAAVATSIIEAEAPVATPLAIEGPPAPVRTKRAQKKRRRAGPRWGVKLAATSAREAALRAAQAGGEEVELPARLLFPTDSATLGDNAHTAVRAIADRLQARPEIRLLMVEGHADARGTRRYNQKLSEARASAARAALVKAGVSADRLVAYGYGEQRPESKRRKDNRRVVFKLVEGDRKALARSASEWGEAAVVGLWGEVRWAYTPETEGGSADSARKASSGPWEPGLDWHPMTLREQLGEGVDVQTGPNGRALLRFPDLTRVTLGPNTRIRLNRVYYDHAARKTWISARLRSGHVQVEANPLGLEGRVLFAFEAGAVETSQARFELRLAEEGHLAIDEGELSVGIGGPTQAMAGGQWTPLSTLSPDARLAAPRILGPLEGSVAAAELAWEEVEGADWYAVEVAADPDFHQLLVWEAARATSHRVRPPGLGPFFWRVRAMDGRAPGVPSHVHAFELQASADSSSAESASQEE